MALRGSVVCGASREVFRNVVAVAIAVVVIVISCFGGGMIGGFLGRMCDGQTAAIGMKRTCIKGKLTHWALLAVVVGLFWIKDFLRFLSIMVLLLK